MFVRVVAGGFGAVAAVSLAWWLFVAIIGVGSFERVPEQGGCYQPEPLYGSALLLIGLIGLGVAGWTVRSAVRTARGRRVDVRFLWGVALALALGVAFVIVAVPLNPESDFGPC
jgi:heme/copper-type cytochrome/quinol oxidase subunit 3